MPWRWHFPPKRSSLNSNLSSPDVGGGNVENTVKSSLADIPLRWMIREVIESKCGIQFDPEAMKAANVKIGDLSTIIKHIEDGSHRCAADAESDKKDVLQPIHDSLSNPLWWILELIPLRFSWQNKEGAWVKAWRYLHAVHFTPFPPHPDHLLLGSTLVVGVTSSNISRALSSMIQSSIVWITQT